MNIEDYQNFAFIILFFVGLIFGSFLNLFVYRYPIIIFREYYKNIKEYANLFQEHEEYIEKNKHIGLCLPNSHCPYCKKEIPIYYNLPVIGYILTKGKCFNCNKYISIQYPVVEFLTGALFSFVGYSFGLSLISLGLCISIFILLSIIIIDYKTYLLPNELTIPLMFIGLILNTKYNLYISGIDSLIGLTLGYLLFSSFILIYEKIRNKGEMMGRGDFCLIAAFGAFFGIESIVIFVLISAIIGILQYIITKTKNEKPIPYGPALSVTFLFFIFFNDYINMNSIINFLN